MTRFHAHKELPVLFFPLILIGIAGAASPDPRLLSLVPPDTQLVAGISASSVQDQPDNFVLMTHNNRVDLQDFFALIGADSSRTVHQIVFVAMASDSGRLNEHSLLVSGNFDQPQIFKSAVEGGAVRTSYRGIPVLEIQPFARERGKFNDVRWLVVLDSSVLVFGSVASTRLELDRYLSHSPTDESLLRRLAHLSSKDQTWCVLSGSVRTLSSPTRDQEIHRSLAELNPKLAELAQSGNELEFGMHYGRRVGFEYEMAIGSLQDDRPGRLSLLSSSHESPNKTSLLPDLNMAEDANTLHGVIEISVSRYKEWLAEIKRAKLPLD